MSELRIVQGDTLSSLIKVISAGEPFDITGAEFSFTAKRKLSDADEDAAISKDWTTHTEASAGKTTLTLTSEQTNITAGVYKFDIQFTLGSMVCTILIGTLTIIEQVTQR